WRHAFFPLSRRRARSGRSSRSSTVAWPTRSRSSTARARRFLSLTCGTVRSPRSSATRSGRRRSPL
ncbi:MAG: hypothetical protein AVDCRST_MAG67-3155, partial [uncultured Solirubrobacteraceae bacterium]